MENTILSGYLVTASCKCLVIAGISIVACVLAVIKVTSTSGLQFVSKHSISANPPDAVKVGKPSSST